MSSDLLAEISGWASSLHWSDVPDDVGQRATWALSDTVSTMVGGASQRSAAIAREVAAVRGGSSPVVGSSLRADPGYAAFANAVAASALDYDDGHFAGGAIHPGCVIIPAVLATSNARTTVEQALLAQVVGYEIGLRVGFLLWRRSDTDLYHSTGTAGAVGAAAASAKLRGADAAQLSRAITTSWFHAPLSTFGMPMVKESAGWGSMTGTVAAELAATGFMSAPAGYAVAPNDIHPPSPFHLARAADPFVTSFGSVFEAGRTYFKFFAACLYTHAALRGLRLLLRDHVVASSEIRSIEVRTHYAAVFLNDPRPLTIEDAQYSFPFVLATLVLHGEVGSRQMTEAALSDDARLDLAARVTVSHDSDLDRYYPECYPSRVTVHTDRGTFSGLFLDASSELGGPLRERELLRKWHGLLDDPLGEETADRLLRELAVPDARIQDALASVFDDRVVL
jgi:2-methylcitrate dehydratase PrpD